jgi:hypothetical protein
LPTVETTLDRPMKIIELLHQLEAATPLACRGDPGNRDALLPSIDRLLPRSGLPAERWYIAERTLIARFAGQAGAHLQVPFHENLSDATQAAILMQHFGAPTRLLDWTESVWVAAYMASESCDDLSSPTGDRRYRDGAIWLFDRMAFDRQSRRDLARAKETHHFQANESMRLWHGFPFQAIYFSRDELSQIGLSGPTTWVTPMYQLLNRFPRLTVQQGFFTIASRLGTDHRAAIEAMLEGHEQSLRRIVIPHSAKAELRYRMERMGVTGGSLFPGLDGLCRHLRDWVEYAGHDPAFCSLD